LNGQAKEMHRREAILTITLSGILVCPRQLHTNARTLVAQFFVKSINKFQRFVKTQSVPKQASKQASEQKNNLSAMALEDGTSNEL